jgi:putative SOS response-associated peptidase YedK
LVESCAIITTRANELAGLVHDRMPVILSRGSWRTWLHQGRGDPTLQETLQELLCPFPANRMTVFPVSTIVNSPRNEKQDCVKPVGPSCKGDIAC